MYHHRDLLQIRKLLSTPCWLQCGMAEVVLCRVLSIWFEDVILFGHTVTPGLVIPACDSGGCRWRVCLQIKDNSTVSNLRTFSGTVTNMDGNQEYILKKLGMYYTRVSFTQLYLVVGMCVTLCKFVCCYIYVSWYLPSIKHLLLFITSSLISFLIHFTYFLLLSIRSLSTRIVPLRFLAWGRRRRPNLGLVCFCVMIMLSVLLG